MNKLISRKEAAKILGISLATLDAARNNGLISYVQYVENGCVYFTEAGLQEYIAKSTHRAKPHGLSHSQSKAIKEIAQLLKFRDFDKTTAPIKSWR